MKRGFVLVLLFAFLLTGCGQSKLGKGEMFSSFKSIDFEGNEVTESLFSENDITMVHFWGSTCGPCLDELDELQEIYEKLPDNVAMIGILADVPMGYDAGKNRAENTLLEAKASFRNLLLDEALNEYASHLSLTPYTVFVDKDGKIVETVKGAAKLGYIEVFDKLVPNLKWKE